MIFVLGFASLSTCIFWPPSVHSGRESRSSWPGLGLGSHLGPSADQAGWVLTPGATRLGQVLSPYFSSPHLTILQKGSKVFLTCWCGYFLYEVALNLCFLFVWFVAMCSECPVAKNINVKPVLGHATGALAFAGPFFPFPENVQLDRNVQTLSTY